MSSDIDDSIIAQLIECGLVARYRNDLKGLRAARQAIRDELAQRRWILPPYSDDGQPL